MDKRFAEVMNMYVEATPFADATLADLISGHYLPEFIAYLMADAVGAVPIPSLDQVEDLECRAALAGERVVSLGKELAEIIGSLSEADRHGVTMLGVVDDRVRETVRSLIMTLLDRAALTDLAKLQRSKLSALE